MVLIRVDLPQPFGPRIAHVLPGPNAERNVVEHLFVAEHHGDPVEGQ